MNAYRFRPRWERVGALLIGFEGDINCHLAALTREGDGGRVLRSNRPQGTRNIARTGYLCRIHLRDDISGFQSRLLGGCALEDGSHQHALLDSEILSQL